MTINIENKAPEKKIRRSFTLDKIVLVEKREDECWMILRF